MNQINQQQIGQHVLILGWLQIIGNAILLAIAVCLFFFLTGIGIGSGDAQAVTVLSTVGTSVGALLTLLALPGIVVGILNLINFPIGTVIGAYTLWALFQNTANDYFATNQKDLQTYKEQPVA